MKSFPSALNRGGNSAKTFGSTVSDSTSSSFDVNRMKAYNLNLTTTVKDELLNEVNMNISTFNRFQSLLQIGDNNSGLTKMASDYISEDVFTAAEQEMRNDKTGNYASLFDKVETAKKNYESAVTGTFDPETGDTKYSGTIETSEGKVSAQTYHQNLEKYQKDVETAQKKLDDYTKSSDYEYQDSEYWQLKSSVELAELKLNNYYKGSADLYNKYVEAQNNLMNAKDEYINKKYTSAKKLEKKSYYENPFKLPSGIISSMNRYKSVYKIPTSAVSDMGYASDDDKKSISIQTSETLATSSMFNPICNIQAVGMTDNVPLLNNLADTGKSISATSGAENDAINPNITVTAYPSRMISDRDITNCSIRELVSLSHKQSSILGMCRYKYADFMYCKDVGKVSNNHLITLRKFSHPVGDNIFRLSSAKYKNKSEAGLFDFTSEGDTGRLISWFDTDDNKLEEIVNFKYQATWKDLHSTIEDVKSEEDSSARGPLGALLNTLNPAYNTACLNGTGGSHDLISMAGAKLGIPQGGNSQNIAAQSFMDSNKVYSPQNTVQDTHIYEGKLVYTHEFTLNFSYKLRAYDNINPKTAFLDLIANILEVTYRKGSFWGGKRRFIGPPVNRAGWNTANKIIDNAWDKLGGFFQGIASGTIDFKSIVQSAAEAVSALADKAKEIVNNIKGEIDGNGGGAGGALRTAMQGLIKLNKKTGFSRGLKAQLKNALGRPAIYCANSLLSGDNVGLWHVTIGNPKNPILVMGNLIMTNAGIQLKGPLGVDDFPTELKVTVTLKPGRSRDATEIGRMFTKGAGSLYQPVDKNKMKHFFNVNSDIERNMADAKKVSQQEANKLTKQKNKNKKIVDATSALKSAQTKLKNAQEKANATTDTGGSDAKAQEKAEKEKKAAQEQVEAAQKEIDKQQKIIDEVSAKYDAKISEAEEWLSKVVQEEDMGVDDNTLLPSPYIDNAMAVRYETHGQDRDVQGRLIIEEMA